MQLSSKAASLDADDELKERWGACLTTLKRSMPSAFYSSFIAPLHPERDPASGGVLLRAPDDRLRRRIVERYITAIESSLREVQLQGPVRIGVFENSDRARSAGRQVVADPPATAIAAAAPDAPAAARPAARHRPAEFSADFIPAELNRRDLERLLRFDFTPPATMLVGGEGSGKSAFGSLLASRAQAAGKRVRKLNFETFLTEFGLACKQRDTIRWRKQLRAHDILFLDDFQFIKKQAERAQEELLHLCDEFAESGAALVLASDRRPGELPLTGALASRLQSGLVIELLYPGPAERERILAAECARLGLELAPRVLERATRRIDRDMRRLKSAARRLERACSGGVCDLGLEEVDALLSDLYTPRPDVRPEEIVLAVAAAFRIDPAALTGPARDQKYALPRHLTAWLCVERLGMNLKETAAVIGRKDHASVIHARRKISELLVRDLFFQSQVRDISDRLFRARG